MKHMWIVEEGIGLDVSIKSFPVGYSFINVIDGNPFNIIEKNRASSYKSYLAGPRSSFYDLNMSFIKRALTIQLQPFALPFFFSMPASEFTEKVVHLSDFMPDFADQLESLISSEQPSIEVLRKVENLLLERVNCSSPDERILCSLDILLKTGGDIRIDKLSYHLNLSQRRLQQLFQQYYGITAKRYSRIIKMQHHTFQLLNGKDLDTVIPDGYFDQSHFIHELRSQTGMLPKEFYNYISHENHKAAYLNSSLFLKRN